jgi:hypothetical protein
VSKQSARLVARAHTGTHAHTRAHTRTRTRTHTYTNNCRVESYNWQRRNFGRNRYQVNRCNLYNICIWGGMSSFKHCHEIKLSWLKPIVHLWVSSGSIISLWRLFITARATKHDKDTDEKTNKTKSVAFSPQVNYTDWRPPLVGNFSANFCGLGGGGSRGQRGGTPTVVNLSFLDRSLYFLLQVALIYAKEAQWTPSQANCYSENVVAPGIEPGTSGSAAANCDY